jgi:hypothetical protein
LTYHLSVTAGGLTVIRPNEVFSHIDAMVQEHYGSPGGLSSSLLALGMQNLPPLHELQGQHPNLTPIGYQLEQLSAGSHFVDSTLSEWLESGVEVWDYDLDNITFLQEQYGVVPEFRPLTYAESLRRIETVPNPDIDVLFYGTHNRRRKTLFRRIRWTNRKANIVWINGWGAQLDALIARSKIVLNLHYYETETQEQARVFYLLINGKCVLSETSRRNYYGDMIMEAERRSLPEAVGYLLAGDRWRDLANEASDSFRRWSESVRVTV